MEARGISGFWMGWTPTILRDVPFSGMSFHNYNYSCLGQPLQVVFINPYFSVAIYWGTYESIKKAAGQTVEPTLGFSFMAGAIAGSVSLTNSTTFGEHPFFPGDENEMLINCLIPLDCNICRPGRRNPDPSI